MHCTNTDTETVQDNATSGYNDNNVDDIMNIVFGEDLVIDVLPTILK